MKIKFNIKKVYNVVFRVAVCILIVLLVSIVPTSIYFVPKNFLEDKFGGNRSDYQGVLELWHIDTFEGGTLGKYQFLKARATDYEKNNQGLYFMVKNMTETECLLALESGQRPAMFSFGVGIGEQILQNLKEFNFSSENVRKEFIDAGKINSSQYAAAWCRGVYSLISTTSAITKAAQDATSMLSSIATSCGYVSALKHNKTKTTYSITFGAAGYVCPQKAYAASYKNLVQNDTSLNSNYANTTSYQAYCNFIEGKASILLGTQRDVARVENRVNQGKLTDVIYQHLPDYTDLVQYVSICNSVKQQQYKECVEFINYLCSEKVQQKLVNIGMFSVIKNANIYSSGVWKDIELLTQEDCLVENAFTNITVLASNKQSCIDVQEV